MSLRISQKRSAPLGSENTLISSGAAPALPEVFPQGTPEALPYPFLRRMSSPSQPRAAPGCRAVRPWPAGGAASAVGKALPPGWGRQKAVCTSYPRPVSACIEAHSPSRSPISRRGCIC